MSKSFFKSIFIFSFLNFNLVLSNSFITFPFFYINKNTRESFPNTTTSKSYFYSFLNYSVYTKQKINDKDLDLHLTLDRHATYISKKRYKEINPEISNEDNDQKLYSLEYIGIYRAKYLKNKLSLFLNNTKEYIYNNFSFFMTMKMSNSSDYEINRYAYATEAEEIGLNILKGNKYTNVNVQEYYDDYSDINLYNTFQVKNDNKLLYSNNPSLLGEPFVLRNDGYNVEENTNIISQLKKNDIISSYVFSIKIDDKNDEKGKIVIGGLPHEIDPKHFNEKYYIYDRVPIDIYYHWHYAFKDIVYDGEKLGWVKDVEFSLDFGFILSTDNYKKFLDQKFFKNATYVDSCKEEKVGEYFVKICKEKVIKNFKTIYFYLSYNYIESNKKNYIEFNYQDLFVKAPGDNDLYYFQIVFVDNSYKWIFGRPLFKKYQTVFDQDKKIIGFYTETGEYNYNNYNNYNNKNKFPLVWIFVIILFICLIILIILFYIKYPFKTKKKKANELDDDFDYESDANKRNEKDQLFIN